MAKGIAYTFISQKRFATAKRVLKEASRLFEEAHYGRGDAVCWSYLADTYAETNQLNRAFRAYEEAANGLQGLDRYQVQLKRLFLTTKQEDVNSVSRMRNLHFLHDEFALMGDYREAIIDVEIAKALYVLGDLNKALFHAQRGVRVLQQVVMPRNAVNAVHTLNTIEGGYPPDWRR